jgi:hypothetical protein
MLDTASAVYEAVEPLIIWKTLYNGLKAGPDGQSSHVSHRNNRIKMGD